MQITDNMLHEKAVHALNTVIDDMFLHRAPAQTLIVYDESSPLSFLLTEAYKHLLPDAATLNFDTTESALILTAIDSLTAGDLVILIQSMSFRLDEFRIRLHLFKQGLKVIEHPHLVRVGESEFETYVNALTYDATYYRTLGPALKARIDRASIGELTGAGLTLTYTGPFEPARLNIGDYRGMKNIGGQFPIGEVFTELVDLTRLNGEIGLFAFGNMQYSITNCDPPIVLCIEKGKVVDTRHITDEFAAILDDIRKHDGDIWVRELGFGLNRAMTRDIQIHEVGIYERMCGFHLSLGSKHAIYPKAGFHRKRVKYHLDVFADVERAHLDHVTVFENGTYCLKEILS